MIMKKIIAILIIAVILSPSLSGCSDRDSGVKGFFDIPEGEKIQEALDDMSEALMSGEMDRVALHFSDICPDRKAELDDLKKFISGIRLKVYEQSVKRSRRLKDGVVCSVEIHYEGAGKEKNVSSRSVKEIYFVYEKGVFKIGDYNYYPYMNPAVVVGSDSILYDSAVSMSEALGSDLTTDKKHLQTCGDIIMVGGPYDNASILELEERGLTAVKVTDDYPGSNTGIVQVLTGVENYRHALIIQGSNVKAAEDAVDYMTGYLKDNPYMNPGVYFIEDNKLRKADPLDLTTLATLDGAKSEQRIREVQKYVEANLALIEEELQMEKEHLRREYRYIGGPYREDYPEAFGGYGFSAGKSSKSGMAAVNAAFMDPGLCTSVFQLPYGSKPGTLYAYARYLDTAPGVPSAYSTAALRLLGFGSGEVFNVQSDSHSEVFSDIGSGYVIAPSRKTPYTPEAKYRADEIFSLHNEGSYIDFEQTASNVNSADILQISEKLNELYDLGRKFSGDRLSKAGFKETESLKSEYLTYDAKDASDLLRTTCISDDVPCIYSSLEEARSKLRSAMGELLSVQCTRFVATAAARYPGSQFDYALYAAGLVNVQHPNAYAKAAEKSKLAAKASGGIANVLSDEASRIEKLLSVLSGISETDADNNKDRFKAPDSVITDRTGSHKDKALLAFGLYCSLFGNAKDAYVAVGDDNSYLAFKSDGGWSYIDCKSNVVKSFINDDIYLVFNKEFVYNRNLGTGEEPEFIP